MSLSPGTRGSPICHSHSLWLCCSYLSQPFWGMLNIRCILLGSPHQELPDPAGFSLASHQDAPPSTALAPSSPCMGSSCPARRTSTKLQHLLPLGPRGRDSANCQHIPAHPQGPQPPQTRPSTLLRQYACFDRHYSSPASPVPHLDPKGPSSAGGGAAFKGRPWSPSSPAQPPPGPRLPLLSTAGATQGQDCPTPATKTGLLKVHLVCSCPNTLVPGEQPHPGGPGAPQLAALSSVQEPRGFPLHC